MISAAGIAIGCAALVVIMSIYNGFDSIIRSLYNSYTPELLITPDQGKTFSPTGEAFDTVRALDGVDAFCEVVEENVYLFYGDRNSVVTAKGVDSKYESITGLRDYLVEGEFDLQDGSVSQVVVGRGLALNLGIRTVFVTPLEIYFPSRTEEISLLNPLASLKKINTFPSGIVSLDQSFDSKYIFLPIDAMRELLEYNDEVSAIEIYSSTNDLKRLKAQVSEVLGDGYVVKDKLEQNDNINKLLQYEKIAIYAILVFVIIIICCNIFGSLSMLIIEKRDDIGILKAMGATDKLIKKIFVLEGWLISLFGIAIGIVLGLIICVMQQRFGIVKMPGNFVVDAYPVVIKVSDILITIGIVALIGYCTALLSNIHLRRENG